MKLFNAILILLVTFTGGVLLLSFTKEGNNSAYMSAYKTRLGSLKAGLGSLMEYVRESDIRSAAAVAAIKTKINGQRKQLKAVDFWLRYLEPTVYKKINAPLPVEWETEVFEKFEKPYKREGAGLTLAELYLEEENRTKDSLLALIQQAVTALQTYSEDSVTAGMQSHHHFFLANRLYLLNLAAIYTTGFECPDTTNIIPELKGMLKDTEPVYEQFNESFSSTPLTAAYRSLYNRLIVFAGNQPDTYSSFDHYQFIKAYINPLFAINQQMIAEYKVFSKSFVDYSLNKKAGSIFSKELYTGQNEKGIFSRVDDAAALEEIAATGKLLFYDPLLSVNNRRSCASCHKPTAYFADTAAALPLHINGLDRLKRNAPSLLNTGYNHLLMLDGRHISLQDQAKDVITNPAELGSTEKEVLEKILSCNDYKKSFGKFLKYTPQEDAVSLQHIIAAITIYYSRFSKYSAPFDNAMNNQGATDSDVQKGFNLFMSKAQCATCHFAPQFNGVKPPYVGSEFEVIGVSADTAFKKLSSDKGRYEVNAAVETLHAFRTGTIRNTAFTKPYMHNGVFSTLEEVIDFYDAGGGAGKGLQVNNQTLSADSLRLTKEEKKNLLAFIRSLTEEIPFEKAPERLPASKLKSLNARRVGGEY